ncbi:MAG: DUF3006 domain-containing protein [Acidobacteria bacterium]|nr:DUF3006 domain-containing protein [Acidobacteriota bacterium]MCA1642421.1 DUF3006 domain-containing protein [Acidobacteriota bacterium]
MTKVDDDDAHEGARKGGKKKGAREDESQGGEVRAVVDRVEDGRIAVVSVEGRESTLDVPLAHLPEGTSDGDHLRLTFDGEPSARTLTKASLDRKARASTENRVKKMQERLEKLSGTEGKKDFKL